MKYWLIAVSSAVSTSLSIEMIAGSPCTRSPQTCTPWTLSVGMRPRRASDRAGDDRLVHVVVGAVLGDHRHHDRLATAAPCRRATGVLDRLERRRPVADGALDGALPNRFAVTDDGHGPVLPFEWLSRLSKG